MTIYYQITLRGHLDHHWSAWFDGMTITNETNGEAVLRGPLADQAALHGVLIKIRPAVDAVAKASIGSQQS